MARFTTVSAIMYFLGKAIAWYDPASIFTVLGSLGFFGLLVSAAYYGHRFFRWLKSRLLWKVRNKIIVSYAFIGIIPVLILGFVSWLSLKVIFGQLGALYLDNEIRGISESLRDTGEQILLGYYRRAESTDGGTDLILQEIRKVLAKRPQALKKMSWAIDRQVPAWAKKGFSGLTLDSGQLYLRNISVVEHESNSHLIYLEIPFDQDLATYIKRRSAISFLKVDPAERGILSDFVSGESDFFSIHWAHELKPVDWPSGEVLGNPVQAVLLAVPLKNIYNYYFNQTTLGQSVLPIFGLLAAAFVLVEVTSIVVAATIARSITRSVHNIYSGTRSIQEGNFEFRIPSGTRDQLESMAGSFNNMADSILRLMRSVAEKERLEKEIEIAREVQTQLFPQALPSIQKLQLAAACLPARRVSGDYYDFIPGGPARLDVVISDISGKGISAALLMASLQSCVRTQLLYRNFQANGCSPINETIVEINRHLYHNTAPDKFATLVLGRFDTEALTLTYCNAGHNPPLLFSKGEIRHLDQGGTVVGLFEQWKFEQEVVPLEPNDLVLFYTDGIVEAENVQDEPFGEDRLIDLVRGNLFLTSDDLQNLIFDELSQWTTGTEQRDDMTVVVVKMG